MNSIGFLPRYLKYYLTAQNEHDIHSPFVFDLITRVIQNENDYYAYEELFELRQELLEDKREITITDLGAGSRVNRSRKRKVRDIAAHSSKPEKYGQLLFRLVNHFQPGTMLELGTSLGISTAYQASARKNARMITIEGCPQTAEIARQTLDRMKLGNVELVTGNFDDVLDDVLKKLGNIDHAYFDGNHRKEPTLRYFEQSLPFAHNDSLFIFDDIHWSGEMEEAWEAIKTHPQVTITIDLLFMGLVFFRKEKKEKEHFVIRF